MVTRCLSQQESDPCHDRVYPNQLHLRQPCSPQSVARFDGGTITSDGGAVLLRQLEQRTGIVRQSPPASAITGKPRRSNTACANWSPSASTGWRSVMRISTITISCAADPLLALLSGKQDLAGAQRRRPRDRGKAGAGKSTLNRLELTPAEAGASSRYKKIVLDTGAADRLLTALYIQSQPRQPERIVLDLDATDDPLHGQQEGRFFHGYYGHYCYLPLYIFAGDQLLCARLRPANIDAAAGALEEVRRIVEQLRRVVARCRDPAAGRRRFLPRRDAELVRGERGRLRDRTAQERPFTAPHPETDEAGAAGVSPRRARRPGAFGDFRYRTRTSWSRRRRVVAKAEYLAKGENPALRGNVADGEASGSARSIRDDLLRRGR